MIAKCSIHPIAYLAPQNIIILLLNLLVLPLNFQCVKWAVQGSRGPPVAEIEFALWSKEPGKTEFQEYSVKQSAAGSLVSFMQHMDPSGFTKSHLRPHPFPGYSIRGTLSIYFHL